MSNDFTTVHAGDQSARHFNPDGNVPWREAIAPDIAAGRTTGRLKGCSYCGSMHPADLAVAIRAGATMSLADQKYGWPHKAYVSGVPNPHAGLLESLSSKSHPTEQEKACGAYIEVPDGFDRTTGAPVTRWVAAGTPAPATVSFAKFYTIHLQDASPEDRETIERALGLAFAFDGKGVYWAGFDSERARALREMPGSPAEYHAAEQRRAASTSQPAVAAVQALDNDGKPTVSTIGFLTTQPPYVPLDLDSNKVLPQNQACDLPGDGTCEVCQ